MGSITDMIKEYKDKIAEDKLKRTIKEYERVKRQNELIRKTQDAKDALEQERAFQKVLIKNSETEMLVPIPKKKEE